MSRNICQFPGCTLEKYHSGGHIIHAGIAHRYGLSGVPARIEPITKFSRRCRASGCVADHSNHSCRICGDSDSNHVSDNCPMLKLSCNASGCHDNHRHHHCKNCGDRDSDHRSVNCPRLHMAPRGVVIVRGGFPQAVVHAPTPFVVGHQPVTTPFVVGHQPLFFAPRFPF